MDKTEKIIVDRIGDTIISITKMHWENGDLIVEIIETDIVQYGQPQSVVL